jgi:ATP-dependent DNA helicase RecQ
VTSRSASSSAGRGERKAKAAAAELPEALQPAFEALRAWRAEQAREQGVPAYVIFHDATLREIALAWPTSVRQLGGISGVGEKKLTTYGEGVLAVLASLGDAPGAAPATDGKQAADGHAADARPAVDGKQTHDDWPELLDEEPEPEPDDWI